MTIARAARLAGLWLGLAGGLAPAAGAQPVGRRRDHHRRAAGTRRFDPGVVLHAARRHAGRSSRRSPSGLPTTFTYDVELRRPSTFWFDKLVDSARIAVTVRFDPLTRRYHVIAAAGRPRRRRAHHRQGRGHAAVGLDLRAAAAVHHPRAAASTPPTTSASAAGPRRAIPGRSGRGRVLRRTAAPASPSSHDPGTPAVARPSPAAAGQPGPDPALDRAPRRGARGDAVAGGALVAAVARLPQLGRPLRGVGRRPDADARAGLRAGAQHPEAGRRAAAGAAVRPLPRQAGDGAARPDADPGRAGAAGRQRDHPQRRQPLVLAADRHGDQLGPRRSPATTTPNGRAPSPPTPPRWRGCSRPSICRRAISRPSAASSAASSGSGS